MGWKELPKWTRVSIYILVISIILKIISNFLPRSTRPLDAILALPFSLISQILGLIILALPVLLALTIFKNEEKKVKSFAKGFLFSSLFNFILLGIYFVLLISDVVRSSGGGYEFPLIGLLIVTELIVGLILLFIGRNK